MRMPEIRIGGCRWADEEAARGEARGRNEGAPRMTDHSDAARESGTLLRDSYT